MSRSAGDVPTDHPAFTQPADPPPPASEVQTSGPVTDPTRDPVTLEPEQADPPPTTAPADEVDEAQPYFRRKDGTFRKATKKEAMGEMHSRISTLTGRLRGTEEELQRVKATPAAPEPPSRPVGPPDATAAGYDPSDPEPDLTHYANEEDPYKAYMRATGLWAARLQQRAWERGQVAQQSRQQVAQTFNERAAAFKAEHPDYDEQLKATNLDLTPAMHHVLMTDEDGPAMAYYLAQHPDAGYQLVMDTMDVTSAGPKLDALRMLLKTRVAAAGSTGSARPAVRSSAPAPLHPVRTGAPALDEPPLTGDVPFSEFVRRGNEADRKRREARSGA